MNETAKGTPTVQPLASSTARIPPHHGQTIAHSQAGRRWAMGNERWGMKQSVHSTPHRRSQHNICNYMDEREFSLSGGVIQSICLYWIQRGLSERTKCMAFISLSKTSSECKSFRRVWVKWRHHDIHVCILLALLVFVMSFQAYKAVFCRSRH